MSYGWCDLCHRAVWIKWVKGRFASGEPYGLCEGCGPDSPRPALTLVGVESQP